MRLHTKRYWPKAVFAFVFSLATLTCGPNADAAALRPARLRCEHQENPQALDASRPRLGWVLRASNPTSRGLRQTAYRILVATTRRSLRQNHGDMWDSGEVRSQESTHVCYAGRSLEPHTTYHWKVRVWDQAGQASDWSGISEFTMGLPTRGDWIARWITSEAKPSPNSGPPNSVALPLFRRRFSTTKSIRRASVFVCGLGHYELRLNGRRVGKREMDPGWTNYRRTCLYSGYEVTDYLQPGENVIGAMLGNGMYNVTGGRYVKFKGSFGVPKLICQLHITYVDGTQKVIATDDSWQWASGPITFSCIFGGEDYDARREQPGWDASSFDASTWTAALVCDGPGGELVAQSAPPIHMAERLPAVSIRPLEAGKYEIDCGLNLSARPFLKVKGRHGAQVTVTCAERRGEPWEGHSYTYTLKGDGIEIFRPRFTYFSFQYLYVAGVHRLGDEGGLAERPELLEAGSEFLTSSAADVGEFRCSNSLFNDIDAMIARSVRSNLQSVLTDCPHREKLGWLEVAHLMGPSVLYHHDAVGLYRKICRDTSQSQLASGLVPDISPEYTRFKDGFFESAEWGSASVQLPALIHRWHGDDDVLREQYPTMASYVRYLAASRDNQGLAKAGLGDWYDWTPQAGHVGYSQLTPLELPATAFLFDNARIVADAAKRMGRDDDSSEFERLAEQVRHDFTRAYYDPAKETIATGSQASLATALYFDLVPEVTRALMLDKLVEQVEKTGFRQTTGEVCFRMLVQTLADEGRSDVVFRLLNRTDAPGYGHMLQLGFKTLSERWDKPGSSMNHCMFGHAREWFQKSVLGIGQAPDSVGFRRVALIPEPVGDLISARGHYDSIHGRIESQWRIVDGKFDWRVTVPPNTSALVHVPAAAVEHVNEGDQPATKAKGVILRSVQSPNPGSVAFPRVVFEVGSGRYRFTSTFPVRSPSAAQ